MKYSYFLLQSEFLRRLCLTLVPTLLDCFSGTSTPQLFERLTATTCVCSLLCQRLKSHFEIHYLFEKRSHESRIRETNTNWAYREAYVKLCSLSFNLQSVLRESRCLEQILEDVDLQDTDYDRVVTSLDVGAQQIDREFGKCHAAFADFRKYVISLQPKYSQKLQATKAELSSSIPEANKTNIMVGKSDFRPQWPDEVFVGMSSAGDVQSAELNDIQSETVSNPCARLLISELKIALRDKAEEWRKREKEALRNQDIEEESQYKEELPIVKQRTVDSCCRRPPLMIVVAPDNRDSGHLTESSLAKQIAAASVSWQIREEQHFSIGDDDSDSDEDTNY